MKDKSKRLWSLCQDGDGAHSSHSTKEYLDIKRVELWWLPAWSPDMNPMEFMWSLLWAGVAKLKPSTNQEVVEFAKKVWAEIPQTTIQHVIDHLDEVYDWIIEHNGDLYKHHK